MKGKRRMEKLSNLKLLEIEGGCSIWLSFISLLGRLVKRRRLWY